jgi:hypothetical protein
MFISFCKHYLLKISEVKNQLPKLRFEILINYLAIYCHSGTKVTKAGIDPHIE